VNALVISGLVMDTILIVWAGRLAVRSLKAKWEEQMRAHAAEVKKARHDGWLAGLSEGMRDRAHDWNLNEGRRIYYGFAEDCRKCGCTNVCVISRRREYWKCLECGHRNPAPLPIEPQKSTTR
jgi:hypothetical protein